MYNKKYKQSVITCATIILIFLSQQATGQLINPAVSQLFYNRYLANPAMAGFGKEGKLQTFVAYAGQMQAIPGSPSYKMLTLDYGSEGSTGMGLNIAQEEAGLLVNTRVMGTYSYKIRLDNAGKEQLRFGISLGLTRSRIDLSKVQGNLNDVAISMYNSRSNFVDADFGVAYANKDFTVEGSVYNLRRRLDKSVSGVDYGVNANYSLYYVAVGKEFKLGSDVVVDGRAALRGIHNYKNILDLGMNVRYQDVPLTGQVVYHSNRSGTFGISFGGRPERQCYFLYTTPTNDLRPFNRGLFELGFRFIGNIRRE